MFYKLKTKVFDTVGHIALMLNLKAAAIGESLYATIKDLYTKPNAHMRVKINDKLSDPFHKHVDVNQGDPLSYTLFSLYINDIIHIL